MELLFKGAKIVETIENYSFVDEFFNGDLSESRGRSPMFTTDQEFWHEVIRNPNEYWGEHIGLYHFVVSDWVPRVPGLYWSNSSLAIRQHKETDVAYQSREWIEFYPAGKSKKVLGGIGTLLLSPTEEGKVLMSVSAGCNASVGIPILIFPQVLEDLKIKQGDLVNIRGAKWQAMDSSWSLRFASTKDIPKGYLVIDNPEKIQIIRGGFPVQFHPFTIMEYEHMDTLLYDFVYVTADSKADDLERKMIDFFNIYAKKDGRNGEYLLNPNLINPLFETRYMCPSDLQQPSEKAKLNLLYQRVRDTHFNNISISLLINDVPKYYQSSISIRSLARQIGLNPALLSEDSATAMSAQLISLCIQREKVEELIDRMVVEYPEVFK